MNLNIPQNIDNLYYDDDLHFGKLFIQQYGTIAHELEIDLKPDLDTIFDFFKTEFQLSELNFIYSNARYKRRRKTEFKELNYNYLVELKEKLWLAVSAYDIRFYYADIEQKKELLQISKKVKTQIKKKKHKGRFYMMTPAEYGGGYNLTPFKIRKTDIDVNLIYNDGFEVIDKAVQAFLKDDKRNGITLFHGKYGTGKSTYIRYLMKHVNKQFIYVPLSVMYAISSPDLVSFFAEQKNSILIIEDCEELIKQRSSSNSGSEALVNLLNIADGLLSDALSVKLICTFNANLNQIDPAILRKGRMAVRYEFKPLAVEKARRLAEINKIDIEINKPVTIAEIFNTDQIVEGISEDKNVGF